MSNSLLAVNVLLHDSVLVDTNRGQHIQGTLVARIDTVEHQADDNLLPCWASLVPEFGLLKIDDFSDVLHDTVQGASGEDLVFVVVGDCNQKLRMAVVHGWTKIVAVLESEVVGIASCCSVYSGVSAEAASSFLQAELTAHVGELLATALEVVSVLGLNSVLNGTGYRVVGTQDIALDQLDLTCGIALETTAASSRSADLSSCFPRFG